MQLSSGSMYIYKHRVVIGFLIFFSVSFTTLMIIYPNSMLRLNLNCDTLQDLKTKQIIQNCTLESSSLYEWYTFTGILVASAILLTHTYFERKEQLNHS
jgi:hypothetical protein